MMAIQATGSGTATRFGRRWGDFSRPNRREGETVQPQGVNLPVAVEWGFVERRRGERSKPIAPFVTQLIACLNVEPWTRTALRDRGGLAGYSANAGFPTGSIVTREF